jgi:DNA-binding PadR family transcriptional regulator
MTHDHRREDEPAAERRFFRKGELKLLVLELLQEQPRHGYDVMRALKDRFGGVYAPSPGTIYPTLELLADLGLVAGVEQEGKRVYTITTAGRRALEDQAAAIDRIRSRMAPWWEPATREQLRQVHIELKGIHRAVARSGGQVERDVLAQITAIIVNARKEVERVLEEHSPGEPTAVETPRRIARSVP